MREDIKSLKICGGKFAEEASLTFWGNTAQANKKTPCALLYGRNGSGKSTIARAFRKIAGNEEETINSAKLCNENGNEIQLTEEEKKNIYVFDQKFIDENIRFEDNGLDTIVMLGSQVDLDERIKELEENISVKRKELDDNKALLDEYNDFRNPKAPDYYIKQMENALRGDENWAGRDKKINASARINTRVDAETYRNFINLKPKMTRDKLIISFNNLLKNLEERKSGIKQILERVPVLNDRVEEDSIVELLLEKIEEPTLTYRDKFLLKVLKERGIEFLYDISSTFNGNDVQNCPFCTKAISKDEKEELVAGVAKVLDDLVIEHQDKLNNARPFEIRLNLSAFNELGNIKNQCESDIEYCNKLIREYNELISKKIKNPYVPIKAPLLRYKLAKRTLKVHLEELEHARKIYNKQISDTKLISEELKRINSEIAHYDIFRYYILFMQHKSEKNTLELKNLALKADYEILCQKLEKLNGEKRNANIAVEFINRSLGYIFFSNNRLKLQYGDEHYQLLANGSSVKPNQISTGETNAIALCYFFSKIGEGKPLEEVYRGNYLIVIDDPITSFDAENKVGMLSYLKSQVQEFILGNLGTKFLVMTHDMMTFTSIFHINEELSSVVKDKYANFAGTQLKNKSWILCDSKLEEYKNNEANEYSRLYNLIYDFAKGSLEASSLPIGNLMRQLMEAFSTFQYKIGIVELSTKENVIELLPNEYRNYFKNYMYRLVLNSGSHKENEAKFNLDMDFQSLYTLEEKKRTAKSILCFLYLLNREHVLAHLRFKGNGFEAKNKQAKLDLETWCKEIKEMVE